MPRSVGINMRIHKFLFEAFLLCATVMASYAQSYETCIDSAEYYVGKERYAEAAEYYRLALKTSPGSPLNSKVFANLGLCLAETGNLDEALQALDIAAVREPESPSILLSRAKVNMLSSRPAEALSDIESVLSLDSLSVSALTLHAKLMVGTGDLKRGSSDYDRLLELAPDNLEIIKGAAMCKSLSGSYADAASLYRKACETEDSPENFIGLVTSLTDAQQLEEAETCVNLAIQKYPREAELYLLRGVLHNLHYRSNEAELDRKTAITLGLPREIAEKAIPPRPKIRK